MGMTEQEAKETGEELKRQYEEKMKYDIRVDSVKLEDLTLEEYERLKELWNKLNALNEKKI